MKIYAPNKNANGVYASIRFIDGVGETDKPHLIEWFRSHGYKLSGNFTTTEKVAETHIIPMENVQETHETPSENVQVKPQEDEVEMMGYSEKVKTFEEMTPNELREWAIENGFGTKIRNTRNKEKLLEILRG